MCSPESPTYQIYDDPEKRAMIAECGFRVAEYLHSEQIGSLVLVDRAARNLYIPVRAAHRELYPEQPAPSVYFLNPAGFLSPELHNEGEYIKRVGQDLAEKTGVPEVDIVDSIRYDKELALGMIAVGAIEYDKDRTHDHRLVVAQKFTALAGDVIKRDEAFNGRVLVLDACIHSGASVLGIATALNDIGVIDVRVGVVNNRRNVVGFETDMQVFADEEIDDLCKPFGSQDGVLKGEGTKLVSGASLLGLSKNDKVRRNELYRIMREGSKLREEFALRKIQPANTYPTSYAAMARFLQLNIDPPFA